MSDRRGSECKWHVDAPLSCQPDAAALLAEYCSLFLTPTKLNRSLQFDRDVKAAVPLGMQYKERWELEDAAADAAGIPFATFIG